MDGWWHELGRPDPYLMVEMHAGDGSRAADVLAERPVCASALRYVLVEQDQHARAGQGAWVPLESPEVVLGPVLPDPEDLDLPAQPRPGIGPLVTSLREMPVTGGVGVVVAIGWVSSLPSDRIEWRDDRWWEVRLAAPAPAAPAPAAPPPAAPAPAAPAPAAPPEPAPAAPGAPAPAGLVEVTVPLDDAASAVASALVPGPRPQGARYARHGTATEWLAAALRAIGSGRVVIADRCSPSTVPTGDGIPPLAVDQLAAVRRPAGYDPGSLPPFAVVTWRLGS